MQNLSKKFYLEQNFFIYAFWFFQAALLSLARVVCLEIMFPQFSLSKVQDLEKLSSLHHIFFVCTLKSHTWN